jgi:ubiquinone/menaquinone biosynthesis C-methylase UbiE
MITIAGLEYWKEYWNVFPAENTGDLQRQVGRTRNRQPVTSEMWDSTLDFVWGHMGIAPSSQVLELCCGNGMLTLPLARKVSSVMAIDFSVPLIRALTERLETEKVNNVTAITGDVNRVDIPEEEFSHALMYFALQHFSEKEAIVLFERVYNALKPGGVFYIGDIPDRVKLWDFANTDEYTSIYFESVKAEAPAIGSWFLKDDLLKLSKWAGFSKAEIVTQPECQINSRYRFDMLATKGAAK